MEQGIKCWRKHYLTCTQIYSHTLTITLPYLFIYRQNENKQSHTCTCDTNLRCCGVFYPFSQTTLLYFIGMSVLLCLLKYACTLVTGSCYYKTNILYLQVCVIMCVIYFIYKFVSLYVYYTLLTGPWYYVSTWFFVHIAKPEIPA